ncbi:nuclease-related domain-containing protein [Planomicrobium okeanokoites]|uniref:Nuclease-related domain-containing protein n=1 Tax=Planomicrobium okeanokoites TaxID=244 RepID=A0ABV7KRN0_PLAOK|nr:nuclease-related domain-containing protein [Planomicrobium okeanokoites]TAA70830.1 NERD domain-containing protein [Planomicrobium okeanokoites]
MSKLQIGLLSETEALKRLLYRLPEQHAQRTFIEKEIYKSAAGKRGEERLEQKVAEFHVDGDYKFLRNVTLAIGDWKVQIDGLLLTDRGAIVIESKNISGKLLFDAANGEFSRTDRDGMRTVMNDPTSQLNKHVRFMDQFFKSQKIKLPVKGLVVFTSKECEFLTKPKSNYVCKTYQLVDYLLHIHQTLPMESTQINLLKISKLLQKHRAPYKRVPLCHQFLIDKADLRTGILCTQCKQHTLQKKKRVGWICSRCKTVDSDAFKLAVQEYFSLVDIELNNRRLREFCQISSVYVTSRLLGTMELEQNGALRNRVYQLKKKD